MSEELRDKIIALEVEIEDYKNYIRLSRQWAISHEHTCDRWNNGEKTCTCGLDAFLSKPRIAIESKIERLESARKHTQQWYAQHYGKLQDWARKVLPEPWVDQFFSCVANGLYHYAEDIGKPYKAVAGFMVTPGGYFKMPDAQQQILFDQCVRAETAEAEVERLQALLNALPKTES